MDKSNIRDDRVEAVLLDVIKGTRPGLAFAKAGIPLQGKSALKDICNDYWKRLDIDKLQDLMVKRMNHRAHKVTLDQEYKFYVRETMKTIDFNRRDELSTAIHRHKAAIPASLVKDPRAVELGPRSLSEYVRHENLARLDKLAAPQTMAPEPRPEAPRYTSPRPETKPTPYN